MLILFSQTLYELVSLFMKANVVTLCKCLAATATAKGSLPCVAAEVFLEVATLGKCKATAYLEANIWLGSTGVRTAVNLQVSFLNKTLAAAGSIANPFLLGFLVGQGSSAAGVV